MKAGKKHIFKVYKIVKFFGEVEVDWDEAEDKDDYLSISEKALHHFEFDWENMEELDSGAYEVSESSFAKLKEEYTKLV